MIHPLVRQFSTARTPIRKVSVRPAGVVRRGSEDEGYAAPEPAEAAPPPPPTVSEEDLKRWEMHSPLVAKSCNS
jgi:hypothetical protein